jgi:hypothetical protein
MDKPREMASGELKRELNLHGNVMITSTVPGSSLKCSKR